MWYKEFLVQTRNPLNEEEKWKAECGREREKRSNAVEEDENDIEDDEDGPELVK